MLTVDFYKMRKTNKRLYVSFVVLAALFLFSSCTKQPGKRPVDYVDPFISTEDDHGQWHPSALVPFEMVKLGPDTYPSSLTGDGDFAHSGYSRSPENLITSYKTCAICWSGSMKSEMSLLTKIY